jgi:ankyrin repeat protein
MGLFDRLFGVSSLIRAIESADKEKAKSIIQRGADVNQKARVTGATALHAACIRDYKDIAELLLSRGADVNCTLSNGGTILHFIAACRDKGSLDMVTFLLSKGARTDVEDCDGNSALHYACTNADPAIAEALIRSGADIHKRNRAGATPLHLCISARHAFLVRLLLDKGVNVNDGNFADGASPLHAAAVAGDAEITELLLSKGADTRAKDENGHTPLELSIAEAGTDHLAVQEILRQAERTGK